jgi:hypothetical protein
MTNEERDLAIRTMLAEAGNQGPEGLLGVANVIRNRVNAGSYGDGVGGVVTKKYAFEPMLHYGTGQGNDPARFHEAEPGYQQAARIFDAAMAGGLPDITNGSTHFIAKDAQTAMGRDIPSWAKGKPLATIGGHSFYAPEGKVDPDTPTVDPSQLATYAATSTPGGSDAANRFVQRSSPTGGQPPIGSTPGKYGGIADMVRMFGQQGAQPAGGAQGGGSNVPFLQRMIWGDKGFNGVLGGIHTPNDGQGLLGHLFGGPSQFPTPPGATAPQAPAGTTGGVLTAPPVTPVQSTPLAAPGADVPLPMARPAALGGPAGVPDMAANLTSGLAAGPTAAAPAFDGALAGAGAAPLAAAAPAMEGAGAGLAGAAGAAGAGASALGPLSALFAMI